MLSVAAAFAFPPDNEAEATKILTNNGMVLEGTVAKIPSMVNRPTAAQGPVGSGSIVVVDDDLRRTYIGHINIREVREGDAGDSLEKINIPQRFAINNGRPITSMGPIISTSKWDGFGRRMLKMRGPGNDTTNIVQGITTLTPLWTQVQALPSAGPKLVLDQRIATSSISAADLHKILSTVIDQNNPDHRLKLVRFFLQAERFNDAQTELEAIVRQFPEFQGLERELDTLRQMRARRGLDELKLRRDSGQHQLSRWLLKNFPHQDIADETLFQVREILKDYEEIDRRIELINQQLPVLLAELDDDRLRSDLAPVVDEIAAELNVNTLDRMASFRRLHDDAELSPSEKLALGISGWLLGSDATDKTAIPTDNAAVAASLVRVRSFITAYLNADNQNDRAAILAAIRAEEGGLPRYAAQLIKNMKPPLPPGEKDASISGLYHLQVPGLQGQSDVAYYVQVPPEYDPHRRYPVVVTLHGAGTDALKQIDWWAGGAAEAGGRLGQGTRHGYIVIAPQWGEPGQKQYGYSAREHAAVLDTLRDAGRRFSIDTDRVFLSGHSMGGDAAWDIGISHPDLWAGVIPIVAQADAAAFNYISRYWQNAKYVPFYFVNGELDGSKMVVNGPQWDRYLPRVGFDCTVVEYLGRGHESFQDEIQRLFEWMGKHRRNFHPDEFECTAMRSWDNYFWWLELSQLPANQVTNPQDWPPPRGTRAMEVAAVVRTAPNGDGNIYVKSSAGVVTVWLSPGLVNFDKRVRVRVGSRSYDAAAPDVGVILEDVRTRGDRIHPFWAKMELNGR